MTSESRTPAVTISLVTWNGFRWLPGCLGSVAAQSFRDYELLIIDNGSTDGGLELLHEWVESDRRGRLVASDTNLGYAAAHNRNISAAQGEAILLLNQDVELDPGFLEAAIAVLRARPDVGAVQGLVWRLDAPGQRSDVVDTTGLEMHRDRRVVSRDQLVRVTDPERYRSMPVWGADGPAPVYRREALLQAREPRSRGGLEVLDEDFFAYKEDVDLAWRLQRLGWGAWFEPAARAWHARGGGDTGVSGWRDVVAANLANPPAVRALSWRNQRLMQLKNEEPGRLLRDLPWVAAREIASWIFIIFADPRRLRSVPDTMRLLPAAWRKRRHITRATQLAGRPSGTQRRASRLASRLRASAAASTIRHLRLNGPRSTYQRVKRELGDLLYPLMRDRSVGPKVEQVRPDQIYLRLDRPRHDALEGAPRASVIGWAHAAAGIDSVRVYMDSELVTTAYLGRARPDVSALRVHLDEDRISGFSALIPLDGLTSGKHELSVVVRDKAGNVKIKARPIRRLDPLAGYRALYEHDQDDLRSILDKQSIERASSIHLVIVDTGEEGSLDETLASLRQQRHTRWTCSVLAAPGASDRVQLPGGCEFVDHANRLLPEIEDPQRMVGFLTAGEILSPLALEAFSMTADDGADLVYADHDIVDGDVGHRDPWFVPDWSPDRLLGQDYVRGSFVARDGRPLRAIVTDVLDPADPCWRYRLLLALTETLDRVEHVPHVLWSEPRTSDADREVNELAAVRTALQRRAGGATVSTTSDWQSGPVRRIEWPLPEPAPLVSVIIPTTGRMDLVEGTLRLLTEWTSYPNRESVFIDNGRGAHPDGIRRLAESGAVVLERDEPFNWSRLNNAGARVATGELLLFLNDDMEAIDPSWMEDLVRHALRPEVGVVGSMLLYPDGMIQHAGVLLVGHGGGAAHLLQGLDPNDDLYLDLQRVTREVSAVTGACLMVARSTFEEVDGFDEELEVSGNDVDFCLRVAATGRRVLWTPWSQLIHHESRSRGSTPYLPDQDRLRERWQGHLRAGDRYFNPNLDADRVDCDLDWSRSER